MTSKFSIDNRELLQRISSGEAVVGIDFGNLIVMELAAFRLAAMDSEPVAWTDEQELRDVDRGGCGYLFTVNPVTPHADERPIILLYRHAQPAPVVPAVEIVAWRVWPEGSYSEGFIVDDTEDPAHKQGDTDAIGRKWVSRPLSFSKVV